MTKHMVKRCYLQPRTIGMVKGRGWYCAARSLRIMAKLETTAPRVVRSLLEWKGMLRRFRAYD